MQSASAKKGGSMNKLILIFFLSVSSAVAQDYMRIKTKDGMLQIVPIEMISKITFDIPNAVGQHQQEMINSVLSTFAVMQNYPNPFNPSTNISFTLPRMNHVSVRIFDVTGRLVTKLLDEQRDEGTHTVVWDSKNSAGQKVSSGMYLYEVRYEGSVVIRKMLMLK